MAQLRPMLEASDRTVPPSSGIRYSLAVVPPRNTSALSPAGDLPQVKMMSLGADELATTTGPPLLLYHASWVLFGFQARTRGEPRLPRSTLEGTGVAFTCTPLVGAAWAGPLMRLAAIWLGDDRKTYNPMSIRTTASKGKPLGIWNAPLCRRNR